MERNLKGKEEEEEEEKGPEGRGPAQ